MTPLSLASSFTRPAVVIARLPDTFLSFTIDISLLLGGRWWGNESGIKHGVSVCETEPLDLGNPELLRWARRLSPALLKIGGTEADRVFYRLKKKKHPNAPTPSAEHDLILKKKLWRKLNSFARKAGAELVFTLGCGWGDRATDGSWLSDGAQRLISYSVRKGFAVRAWELGNEVNGYPYIDGLSKRVSPKRYGRDFATFSRLVRELDPEARAVGPASAVWPYIGEPNAIIPYITKSGVMSPNDIVSWHYYPQQSRRGGFALRRVSKKKPLLGFGLNDVRRWARRIRRYAGTKEVWMTETGHALYGGEPGASDKFLSTLWWLDLLGTLAQEGVSHVFRQCLIGGDYGLLDQTTLDLRPDYYASFLWKKLMGPEVYPVQESPVRPLRIYRHSSAAKGFSQCHLLINLDADPISVGLPEQEVETYVLTPAGPLDSGYACLNGILLEPSFIETWKKKKTRLKYGLTSKDHQGSVVLPAYSCTFLLTETKEWVPPEG